MKRWFTAKNAGKTDCVQIEVRDDYTMNMLALDFDKLSDEIEQSDIDLLEAIIATPSSKLSAFPLNSFFVPKWKALDTLVTRMRMTHQYHKYLVCTDSYRDKDSCFMRGSGKIVDYVHLTRGANTQRIEIPMKELEPFLSQMHLGITKLRFNFKNVTASAADYEQKYQHKEQSAGIGHIRLWWVAPIEDCDRKVSSKSSVGSAEKLEPIQWNKVYLKDSALTFKMVNDQHFSVSIMDLYGLSLYNRRLIDYGKIEPMHLEISVNGAYSLQCDGIELEIEFIKKGTKSISVSQEHKPIHRFCKSGSVELLKYTLEQKRFDVNAGQKRSYQRKGWTPLHVVCGNEVIDRDVVELLIGNGVQINRQNSDGDTALDLLTKTKNKSSRNAEVNHEAEQLLLSHGAQYNTEKPRAKADDPRLKEYLNMIKIGVPIWAVIQHMKKKGADKGLIADIEQMQLQHEQGGASNEHIADQ